MKKILMILALAVATLSVSAQYYQDNINPEMLRMEQPRSFLRKEFYAPSVDGYTAYKADFLCNNRKYKVTLCKGHIKIFLPACANTYAKKAA